jgi:glycosyltransferase involved in cell wall biosynthesis
MAAAFSIVVPVYNVANYLAACVDSILQQGCRDVEIILIDDRSTDESGAICDRYARTYDNVRAIHLARNEGVAAARNYGLAVAGGDYVIFVDSDDCLFPGSLAGLRQLVERENGIEIIICRFVSESKVLSNNSMFITGKNGKLSADTVLDHLIKSDFYLDHCWHYAISRDLIARHSVRFIDSVVAEDAEYIVKVLSLASSIAYYEGDFYWYRQRDGSLKNIVGVAETASFLRVAHAMRQVMERNDLGEVQKTFIASQIRHSLGVFSSRLGLLSDADMSDFPSVISPTEFPPNLPVSTSEDIPAVLRAHRRAIEDTTLSLAESAKGRAIYVYCTGPNGEAVIRSLLAAGYAVSNVIDDDEALSGRTLLGVPIRTGAHFSTLTSEELCAAFIIVCTQKRLVFEKIASALSGRGIARDQIVHRIF